MSEAELAKIGVVGGEGVGPGVVREGLAVRGADRPWAARFVSRRPCAPGPSLVLALMCVLRRGDDEAVGQPNAGRVGRAVAVRDLHQFSVLPGRSPYRLAPVRTPRFH